MSTVSVTSGSVKPGRQLEDGWSFDVEVSDGVHDVTKHTVEVDEAHWEILTNKAIKPDELVHRSFEFLLKREPKESILKEFNLRKIESYFPEYEEEIKDGIVGHS